MRWVSYVIDTALLVAALALVAILRLNPLVTPWLAVKLAFVIAYIVFGALALKRARPGIFVGLVVLCDGVHDRAPT